MKNVTKILMMCFLSAIAVNVNAAMLSAGDQLIVGGTLLTDTGVLDTATTVQLSTVIGVDGGGSFAVGGINNVWNVNGSGGDAASLTSFSPVAGFMSIDGWTLNLGSLDSVIQLTTLGTLALDGTGTLSDVDGLHDVTWSFTGQSATSYSMDVTVVPVPAAVWLFGSGLIGLVGLARRKA